jgi:hypothetical protein
MKLKWKLPGRWKGEGNREWGIRKINRRDKYDHIHYITYGNVVTKPLNTYNLIDANKIRKSIQKNGFEQDYVKNYSELIPWEALEDSYLLFLLCEKKHFFNCTKYYIVIFPYMHILWSNSLTPHYFFLSPSNTFS